MATGTQVTISTCLWFDDQAEEAARFYVDIFSNSRITSVSRYPDVGQEIHGRDAGTVMTVSFELDGRSFTALNGGPVFKFNEAVSFVVHCANQQEVDYYSDKLSSGGDPNAQQCGWLKDKYGVSWQVVPDVLLDMLKETGTPRSSRVFVAMLGMKKLDIAALKKAWSE